MILTYTKIKSAVLFNKLVKIPHYGYEGEISDVLFLYWYKFQLIIGKHRSSEKLWLKEGRNYADPESVQGMLELGLKRLRSLNYPRVTLSSRTDGGVHAINTSAHFDLERYGSRIYEPGDIICTLNKFFFKNNINIIVRQCHRVNDNFNARYQAIGRNYLYRLAVLKNTSLLENGRLSTYIPIEELRKCHFIRVENFDINRLKEGAKYFVGIHDFTTFKKFDKLKQYKHNRRELYGIDVYPGRPMVTSQTDAKDGLFEYWDILFRGRAFVHNQIRRMMGTLISVANGKIAPQEIKLMLQIPSKHSWPVSAATSPPDGLYLVNVLYRPEDLIYDPDANERQIAATQDCESDSEVF